MYERFDSNNILIQRFGAIGFIKESSERKMTYFIITDINGNLIEDANKYLNKEIGDAKYKKRERAFSALKVFFSFLRLLHINNPTDLTNDDIKDLRLFLEGCLYLKRLEPHFLLWLHLGPMTGFINISLP